MPHIRFKKVKGQWYKYEVTEKYIGPATEEELKKVESRFTKRQLILAKLPPLTKQGSQHYKEDTKMVRGRLPGDPEIPKDFKEAYDQWKRSGIKKERFIQQCVDEGYAREEVEAWMEVLA